MKQVMDGKKKGGSMPHQQILSLETLFRIDFGLPEGSTGCFL